MADSEKLQCTASVDLNEQVERYQKAKDFENQSDAVRELVKIGLRESKSPILYRFKDRVVRWAGDLAVFGILAVLIGLGTPALSRRDGFILGVGLALSGMFLLAIVEVARVVGGTNATGFSIRQALSGLRGREN